MNRRPAYALVGRIEGRWRIGARFWRSVEPETVTAEVIGPAPAYHLHIHVSTADQARELLAALPLQRGAIVTAITEGEAR